MSSPLREIIASFDVDTSKAQQGMQTLDAKVQKAAQTLGALADAFVNSAFVKGITSFVEHQIQAGSAVNDLSEKLGVGTDELQAFQFAAGMVGVSAEEAAKGLQFLNKNVGEAVSGNAEATSTLQKLGVAIKDGSGEVRDAANLMPDLAEAFSKLDSDAER